MTANHIAAIHVLKAKLRLTDEDYRALLLHITGRSSSKDCTPYQQRQVRRHLQQLNTSFQHLLDEVRYDKARQLLLNTDLPIYLIAEQLGYSETASFRHAFQRWSGLAPSELRR